METHPLLPEDLTRLRPFVRALVADDASTDDILQETWLRSRRSLAHDQGPSAAMAWARRTAERLVWSRSRAERSRTARERHVASERGLSPDPADQLAAIELMRRVLGKLAELPESDRQALTLRYLGNESARSIATRLGVSEDAARQRVHRAMKRLRAELDAEQHGGRSAWAGPLIGLVGTAGTKSPWLPAIKLAASAGLLASVGIGLALAADPARPRAESKVASPSVALNLVEPAAGPIVASNPGADREPVHSTPGASMLEPGPPALAAGQSFEVTLLEGPGDTPLAGVEVWWLASAKNPIRGSARTDAEGRLRLPFYPGYHWHVGLALQPEGHALHSPAWQGHDSLAQLLADPVLRFEPGVLLSGFLRDPAGEPIHDARVHLLNARPGYGYHGDWWPENLGWWSPTLPNGHFSLWADDLDVDLEIYHPAHGLLGLYSEDQPATFEALGRGTAELILGSAPAYRGLVTNSAGEPLPDADVTLIRHHFSQRSIATRTDATGAFRLAEFDSGWLDSAAVPPVLLVRKLGYRGVVLQADSGPVIETVALASAPVLKVRVLRGDGAPLVGAQAWLYEEGFDPKEEQPYSDLQPRLTGTKGLVQFDSVLQGGFRLLVSADGFDSESRTMEEPPTEPVEVRLEPSEFITVRLTAPGTRAAVSPDSAIVDYVEGGEPRSYQPFILPDEAGFFRIARVQARLGEFTVRLRVQGFEPIELGPLFPEQGSQRFERTLRPAGYTLKGLLLDHEGNPLAGVPIAALEGPFERAWSNDTQQLALQRNGTKTASDGSFQVPDLGPTAVLLAGPRLGFAFSTITEFQRNGNVLRARPFAHAYLGREPFVAGTSGEFTQVARATISDPELRFAFVVTSPGGEVPDAHMIFPGQRSSAGGGVVFMTAPSGPSDLVWSPLAPKAESDGLEKALSHVSPIGPDDLWRYSSSAPTEVRLDRAPLGGPSGSRRFDLAEGEHLELLWEE